MTNNNSPKVYGISTFPVALYHWAVLPGVTKEKAIAYLPAGATIHKIYINLVGDVCISYSIDVDNLIP